MRTTTPTADESGFPSGPGSVPAIPLQRTIAGHLSGQDSATPGTELEDVERYVAKRHGALLRAAYLLTGDRHTAERPRGRAPGAFTAERFGSPPSRSPRALPGGADSGGGGLERTGGSAVREAH
jgi:hypothetical protein